VLFLFRSLPYDEICEQLLIVVAVAGEAVDEDEGNLGQKMELALGSVVYFSIISITG